MAETVKPVEKQVAAIVLAAGGSTRMGKPKLLLDWHGQPLIRWVAHLALTTGCSPVIVVTGANEEDVRLALADLPLVFTHNPDWQNGQSSSVKAGINALPDSVDAAIIFLGDQPHIPSRVPLELLRVYSQEGQAESIFIPTFNGNRANPVLLQRRIFEPLKMLQGDAGARMIFAQHPIRLIPFDEADLLLDIDSPADYQKLMEKPAPRYEN